MPSKATSSDDLRLEATLSQELVSLAARTHKADLPLLDGEGLGEKRSRVQEATWLRKSRQDTRLLTGQPLAPPGYWGRQDPTPVCVKDPRRQVSPGQSHSKAWGVGGEV